MPFHPYYTVKDGFAVVAVHDPVRGLRLLSCPRRSATSTTTSPANPLVTPAHIVPEWYLLPFYAILRAIPDKLIGVMALGGAIGMLFVLPWLDTLQGALDALPAARRGSTSSSSSSPAWSLGWCGAQEPDAHGDPGRRPAFNFIDYQHQQRRLAQPHRRRSTISSSSWSSLRSCGLCETPLPVPESISTPVLGASGRRARRRRRRAREEGLIGRCCASSRPRGGLGARPAPAAPALAATTAGAAQGRPLVVRGPVRHVRPGAAAARLQGLSRGLLGLPLDEHGRTSATSAIRAARSGTRSTRTRTTIRCVKAIAKRLPDRRHRLRHRRCRSSGRRPRADYFAVALPERRRRPGRQRRRAAAGHVAAGQGARGRAGLHLFDRHRRTRPTPGRPDRAARQVLRPLHPGDLSAPTGTAIRTRCRPAASSPCRRR